MAEHGIVFNVRVQMPDTPKDNVGAIPYEQMMATFDRTRTAGKKVGWVAALTALREVAESRANTYPDGARMLDEFISAAAETRHCPYRDAAPSFDARKDQNDG